MVDYKPLPTSEKEEIPPPVAAPPVPRPAGRRARWARFSKYLVIFGAAYYVFLCAALKFKAEVEVEAEGWLANPFDTHRGPRSHSKGHKILNGNKAEELFL